MVTLRLFCIVASEQFVGCVQGLLNVVRVLLDCDADTELHSNCGETALLKVSITGCS